MRVNRLFRLTRDERGVSAVIVAICLLVIFGIAALAIDASGLYARHQHTVVAADAAALAFAEACITSGNPDTAADQLASSNGGAVRNGPAPWPVIGTCNPASSSDAGQVTVTYQTQQALHFAPVLGFASTRSVNATATAKWGGSGNSIVPPFEVTQSALNNCHFPGFPGPPPPGPEPQCTLLFPKLGNGDWGGMNLSNPPLPPAACQGSTPYGWNVCTANRASCKGASASDAQNWMLNGFGPLNLNPSGNTWVCADNGQATSVWAIFNSNLVGKIVCVPVSDPTKQFPPIPASPVAFDVIAFVPIRIVSYQHRGGNDFLTISWAGPQPCGSDVGGPGGFGARGTQLSG
jgi:Flp pilus assembly protein TadG